MRTVYLSRGFEIIISGKSRCPYTNKETESAAINKNIRRYLSYGCERLVIYQNGKPVSGLQIMIHPFYALVANVYTIPSKRRKGFARQLWEEAKVHYPIIFHSMNLSEDGKIFSQHCN